MNYTPSWSFDGPYLDSETHITGVAGFSNYMLNKYNLNVELLKRLFERGGIYFKKISKLDHTTSPEYAIVRVVDIKKRVNVLILTVDDPTGSLSLNIYEKDPLFKDPSVKQLLKGIHVGIEITPVGEDHWKLNKILYPVESNKPLKDYQLSQPCKIAVVSDVHVGAFTHLADEFSRAIDFINNDSAIKYLIIAGDFVDGAGIHKTHKFQLKYKTNEQQYFLGGKYLSKLRSDITVIFSVGNHDMTASAAEPQEKLDASMMKHFSSNVYFVPNPAWLTIEGYKVLVYHGRTLDQLVANIEAFSYDRPMDLMKYLLNIRHLSPLYSRKSIHYHYGKDYHFIKDLPQIFITGHIHSLGVEIYNNTLLVNSGTWQKLTKFQKRMGLTPTPGVLVIINLNDIKAYELHPFYQKTLDS